MIIRNINIEATMGQALSGSPAAVIAGLAQAMAIAIAAQAAARADQGIGRKQAPMNTAATASTTAAAQGPATRNSPAIETATNSGFFQRSGAR